MAQRANFLKQRVMKSGQYAYIGRKQKNVFLEDFGFFKFLLLAS